MKDFIANVFELWGGCYFGDFSKYMYKADLYGEVALWIVLIPLVVFFIYYKPLDHIKLAKPSIWVAILIVVSLIVAFIGYNIASSGIEDYLMSLHRAEILGVGIRPHVFDDGRVIPRMYVRKLVLGKVRVALYLRLRWLRRTSAIPAIAATLHPALLLAQVAALLWLLVLWLGLWGSLRRLLLCSLLRRLLLRSLLRRLLIPLLGLRGVPRRTKLVLGFRLAFGLHR